MEEQKKKLLKYNLIAIYILIAILLFFLILFIISDCNVVDEGVYDYCIEWENPDGGTLHRDNMLYNCYNLATQEFRCDYEIYSDGRLMIKPIKNTTEDENGLITEIIYDEPRYFNCSRWLKSKKLK